MLKSYSTPLTALALSGLLVLAGCGDDDSPTEPLPPVAAEVVVSPAQVTLTAVGQTETLTATAFDDDGVELEGADIEWGTSDEFTVTVTDDGVVEAVSAGTAQVTAQSGPAVGYTEVTVNISN